MDSAIRDALRTFTLKARERLLAEVGDLLEGIYGLLPSGTFEPAKNYPALKALPAAAETRARLEKFLADEADAGLPRKEAREKLAKETAFTWLNRLVALKTLEERKLIKQSVSKGADSNGFKLWLTEASNEEHRKAYEAGDLPQNALGEGPRQGAYRAYLLHQCAGMAREIRVLFDPASLPSRLFPRPRALQKVLSLLNAADLAPAWRAGNEETIGWVYQYFNEEEKKDVFERLYKQKQKIRREDIPAASQIFTPRWIVKFLVENTLGACGSRCTPTVVCGSSLSTSCRFRTIRQRANRRA